uniref:(California timema) hypothetical protein n=1 Tax=Timema californicum TaxID=61474 RepID=A0A7R9P7V6_TIMCA|nr:unnamed protein product [Timema californicum]
MSSKQTLQNESGTSDDEGVGESGILTKLKIARQEAIVQQLSAGMTEEQLEEEKETEKQQLEAILQLLRQQEEKFQVKEGFGNQINLCRDRGLNLGPPAHKSDTLPLDRQVIPSPPNKHLKVMNHDMGVTSITNT